MKLKDWIAITSGVDEFEIFGIDRYYYPNTKAEMLNLHGEDEIDEVIISTEDDWVQARIYLK